MFLLVPFSFQSMEREKLEMDKLTDAADQHVTATDQIEFSRERPERRQNSNVQWLEFGSRRLSGMRRLIVLSKQTDVPQVV